MRLDEIVSGHAPAREPADVHCCGQIPLRGSTQEWYETASRDAGKRTRELRKLGYVARSCAMGSQVTKVGRVKMTLVTIEHGPDRIPPKPKRISRL